MGCRTANFASNVVSFVIGAAREGRINRNASRLVNIFHRCLIALNCMFVKMGHSRPLFVHFRSFQTIDSIKTVDFSGIRTWIVGLECEHADHLTTTDH